MWEGRGDVVVVVVDDDVGGSAIVLSGLFVGWFADGG